MTSRSYVLFYFFYEAMEIEGARQRIQYAKTKSYATSKRDDPNFVPPSAVAARAVASLAGPSSDKRAREEDGAADGRPVKKEKSRGDDEDDEEMEIEEDEDAAPPGMPAGDSYECPCLCVSLCSTVRRGQAIGPLALHKSSRGGDGRRVVAIVQTVRAPSNHLHSSLCSNSLILPDTKGSRTPKLYQPRTQMLRVKR